MKREQVIKKKIQQYLELARSHRQRAAICLSAHGRIRIEGAERLGLALWYDEQIVALRKLVYS